MDVMEHGADNFNTERSSPTMKTASNDGISVKYGAAAPGHDTLSLGNDLGKALKTMKEHRQEYPNSPAKMGAWDVQDK